MARLNLEQSSGILKLKQKRQTFSVSGVVSVCKQILKFT